jgi:hypothetical protein
MLPYAFRPLRNEYLAVAKIISTDHYLDMDEQSFLALFMRHTNGSGDPKKARQIYYALMKDAGIK